VVEPGGGADFGEEAVVAHRGVELCVQHLERDGPVVLEVRREKDGGRPAAPYLALKGVSIRDRGGKLFRELGRLIGHYTTPTGSWSEGESPRARRQCFD